MIRQTSALTLNNESEQNKKQTQITTTIVYNPNFRRGSSILRSSPETDTDTEADKWQNLPKEIWKQAAEVND